MSRLVALVVVFLAFSLYTVEVVLTQGFAPLTELCLSFGWGSQMMVDLVIGLLAFTAFAWPDAKRRGISFAPYLLATILLGSIGVLAYLIHRELVAVRRTHRGAQTA
jgi:hypothetical protein